MTDWCEREKKKKKMLSWYSWATFRYSVAYASILLEPSMFFFHQIFGTAILLICVLALTDAHHSGSRTALTPFCVGGVVVAIGMTFGLNCGYAINPARDLAPRIFTAVAGWGHSPFRSALIAFKKTIKTKQNIFLIFLIIQIFFKTYS